MTNRTPNLRPRVLAPMLFAGLSGLLHCGGGQAANSSAPVVAPAITQEPEDTTVVAGQNATFRVSATGTGPLTYQWMKNGTGVGSSASNYRAATTQADHNARISMRVLNGAGHVDSSEAVLMVNPSTGSALIINHTHTHLPQVPSTWLTAAKADLKIAYGHSSHGSQIITGMNALMASTGSPYTWNEGGTDGALKIDDAAMGGDVGYFPAWVNNTRSYLGAPNGATGRGSSHSDINVIVWSWCGQAASRSHQEMIDTYLAPMTQLEADYPSIKFVYMTGHLDGSGGGGQLHQRNEQIRAYCQANNKILFDFADIESVAPDGSTNYMALKGDDGCNYDGDDNGSRESNWATIWLGSHPGDPLAILAASCGDCAHSQRLNCIQKGRAAWWLWARLAGWGG